MSYWSYLDSDFENKVDRVKSNLLEYYTSQQISQGARLIGFAVGAFTLLQLVLHQNRISQIFPDVKLIFTISEFSVSLDFVKVFFLALVTFILIVWIIRGIFRFGVFSYQASCIILVKASEVRGYRDEYACKQACVQPPPQDRELSIHQAVTEVTIKRMSEISSRVYWSFPYLWFISTSTERQIWKGWIVAAGLAVVSTLLLFWLLW